MQEKIYTNSTCNKCVSSSVNVRYNFLASHILLKIGREVWLNSPKEINHASLNLSNLLCILSRYFEKHHLFQVFKQLSLLQYKVAWDECQIVHEITSDIKKQDNVCACAEAIGQSFPIHLKLTT